MITLIWLVHLDKRWFCSLSCPIINLMWFVAVLYCLIMAALNLYVLYREEVCDDLLYHMLFNTGVLIVQGILCQSIYNNTLLRLGKKQINKYEDRPDIVRRLTSWSVQKTLLSKTGFTLFFIGIIYNIWAIRAYYDLKKSSCMDIQTQLLKIEVLVAIVTSIPIIFMVGSYILIKTLTLCTSSLFPNFYITVKRSRCCS